MGDERAELARELEDLAAGAHAVFASALPEVQAYAERLHECEADCGALDPDDAGPLVHGVDRIARALDLQTERLGCFARAVVPEPYVETELLPILRSAAEATASASPCPRRPPALTVGYGLPATLPGAPDHLRHVFRGLFALAVEARTDGPERAVVRSGVPRVDEDGRHHVVVEVPGLRLARSARPTPAPWTWSGLVEGLHPSSSGMAALLVPRLVEGYGGRTWVLEGEAGGVEVHLTWPRPAVDAGLESGGGALGALPLGPRVLRERIAALACTLHGATHHTVWLQPWLRFADEALLPGAPREVRERTAALAETSSALFRLGTAMGDLWRVHDHFARTDVPPPLDGTATVGAAVEYAVRRLGRAWVDAGATLERAPGFPDELPVPRGGGDAVKHLLLALLSSALGRRRDARGLHVVLGTGALDTPGFRRLTVEDDGEDTRREDDDARFRAFHGYAPPGAGRDALFGLGLLVARRIVEAVGGRCWLGPTPGGGTTVHVTWPRA